MAVEALIAPVSGADPCGSDLEWDPAMIQLDQAMSAALAQNEAVVEGEQIGADGPSFEGIIRIAEELSARTKDIRVLCIYAEACWRDQGLPGFAEAMEALAAVIETWPDPATGVHPRADEEDGDLGARAAPLGRLMYQLPVLARTVGWGTERPEQAVRVATGQLLRQVFETWEERLGPALGPSLPSQREAWGALQSFAAEAQQGESALEAADAGGAEGEPNLAGSASGEAAADPWELIDRALKRMTVIDRHSPALPILQLLLSWREVGIMEIAESMKGSGITLEQLLESIKAQTGTES